MGQKLTTKSEFAALAGVNPSTVTRIAKTTLLRAMVGKRVDAAHPDAVAYLKTKAATPPPPPAAGIDGRYQEAVETCKASGRWSISGLQRAMGIGYERSKRIVDTMRVAGLIPDNPLPVVNMSAVLAAGSVADLNGRPVPKSHMPPSASEPPSDPGDFSTFDIPEDIRAFVGMTLGDLIHQFGTDTRFLDWLKATKSIEEINEKRLKNATTEGALVSRDLVRKGIIEPFDAAHIKLLTDGAKTITRRATAMHDADRPLDDIEKFVKDQITSFIRPVKAKVARALRDA